MEAERVFHSTCCFCKNLIALYQMRLFWDKTILGEGFKEPLVAYDAFPLKDSAHVLYGSRAETLMIAAADYVGDFWCILKQQESTAPLNLSMGRGDD